MNNTTRNQEVPISSLELERLSESLGWIYCIAWTIVFWPQIWKNWRSKSVAGLNFDFLTIVTFDLSMYSAFNFALYGVTTIKDAYLLEMKTDVAPVKTNDLVFSICSLLCCIIMIVQAYFYETGGQTVTKTCKGFIALVLIYFVSILIPALIGTLKIVDFFTFISYIKIATTMKYIPQVWMNCKRGSTEGLSIATIILDITGGSFSVGQMLVNCYNKNDWSSLEGNATKLVVGTLSVTFDVILIIQYFLFGYNIPRKVLTNEQDAESNEKRES